MQSREQIHDMVRDSLAELFELDPTRIKLDAHLNDDLEIDSIDAVDLIDRLKKSTGKKMTADDFRSVRTVNDLVLAIERLQAS
ncbi:MAG: acyl carrier protein [Pseudomonadales bacterium]|jgi:acyl carrier protein|nr:acyl carrier protein [Pseudomonadales bacterium]